MEKITFKDGTVINAEKNGSCFIVDEKPSFPEDLKEITIEGEGGTTEIGNGRIVESASVDGRYWFAVIEIPEAELEKQATADAIMELSELVGALLS
jgi:hypothetical protein